jgi:CheY-like chemotaxis protein
MSPSTAKKILLVDDDVVVSQMLGGFLSTKGFDVVFAADGVEALKSLEDQSPLPDHIVTDLNMSGMGGEEFVQLLRNNQNTSTIKVILCSAQAGLAAKAETLGAQSFLRKPYKLEALLVLLGERHSP